MVLETVRTFHSLDGATVWERARQSPDAVGRGCSRLRAAAVRLPLAVEFLVGAVHDCWN